MILFCSQEKLRHSRDGHVVEKSGPDNDLIAARVEVRRLVGLFGPLRSINLHNRSSYRRCVRILERAAPVGDTLSDDWTRSEYSLPLRSCRSRLLNLGVVELRVGTGLLHKISETTASVGSSQSWRPENGTGSSLLDCCNLRPRPPSLLSA